MRKPTLKCSVCEGPMWQGTGAKSDGTQTCRPCRKRRNEEITGPFNVTCADCGNTFETKRTKDKSCSSCRYAAMKARGALKGTCMVGNCDDPQFCKSMCNRHYWANHADGAPRVYPDIHKVCDFCGNDFTTKTKRTIYCSSTCGVRAHHKTNCLATLSDSTELIHVPSAPQPKPSWAGHEIPARKGLALVSGPCGWCGETFVGQPMTRYCSKRCSSNRAWKRQHDLRGDFTISPKIRMAIYERDSWTCQICYSPVPKDATHGDYEYATLDHIIPQSHQLIPDHSPSNLRLAHMWCNAKRGNRAEYDMTA